MRWAEWGEGPELTAWVFIREGRRGVCVPEREQARDGDSGLRTRVNSGNGLQELVN